jgi:aminodeoxyfutalosine deaminase
MPANRNFPTDRAMSPSQPSQDVLSEWFISLPKAELHLHLEGSMQPSTVCALASAHGITVSENEVRKRYAYADFFEFLEAFKWVTSLLRDPADYARVLHDLAEQLIAQHVVYSELTLSVGVMLLRGQNVEANFAALLEATEPFLARGLRFNFIFDAVRQFGAQAAMKVVECAERCACSSIVAFGIGGDELSLPASEFRAVYEKAAAIGLRRIIHAGEMGGPKQIRDAIDFLGVERIGHGIAAIHDPALMDLLVERRIPLEICPQSNIRTGALAAQLRRSSATIEQHPLLDLFRHGIPVVLGSDDPAMFHTDLLSEYETALRLGLSEEELVRLSAMSFDHAFLSEADRQRFQRPRQV